MDWVTLFDRADEYETDVATIRETLTARRRDDDADTGREEANTGREDVDAEGEDA